MPRRDIVVIGASAGGVEALRELISALPAGLPATIFVVLHFPVQSTSVLPKILERAGNMPASHPAQGELFRPGRIYIAPPNQHLQVDNGRIDLVTGPREHGFRPAIDRLFRSAAVAHGERVVGVILSGTLFDGAAGMQAIHRNGGVAIVQDPVEALFSSLPRSVIEGESVDFILPLAGIAEKINELAREPESPGDRRIPMIKKAGREDEQSNPFEGTEAIRDDVRDFENGNDSNMRTIISCPDCGGVLWESRSGDLLSYECQTGHVYNEDSLVAEQFDILESALWSAIRVLEQRAALTARMAVYAKSRGHQLSADRFQRASQDSGRNASIIQQLIQRDQI